STVGPRSGFAPTLPVSDNGAGTVATMAEGSPGRLPPGWGDPSRTEVPQVGSVATRVMISGAFPTVASDAPALAVSAPADWGQVGPADNAASAASFPVSTAAVTSKILYLQEAGTSALISVG